MKSLTVFFSPLLNVYQRVFSGGIRGLLPASGALVLALVLSLQSCLTPDPRFHQKNRRASTAGQDSVQRPPSAAPARAEPHAPESPRQREVGAATSAAQSADFERGVSKSQARVLQSYDPELSLVKENGRTYGLYRLKANEALYSAVVVRFTGRVEAADVNQIARDLMALNGLHDETKIPVGAEIRIPLELIDEAFFTEREQPPRVSPRRGHFKHVILDAGHGGSDPGTIVRGLREDEIAFDLAKRVRAGLSQRGVQVHTLVSTQDDAGKMANGRAPREGKRHQYLQVTPAYSMEDSRTALNLRIYLVEDIYGRLLQRGVPPEDIVFISIHLDHLHPSVGGTMIYISDAQDRISSFKASGEAYAKFVESRKPAILFDAHENQLAEEASEAFAQAVIAALRRQNLPVHTHKPIRRHVYRGGDKWTPGIIRYSRVPTSVLIEAANLAHRADWQRIRSADFRQRWANALVRAIVSSN